MIRASALSRHTRVSRGAIAALFATLIAATSHSLGGGNVTWLALIATTIVALPLCVALAGTLGSLWRIGIAVSGSQFLFHWSFSGLGGVSQVLRDPSTAHAHHITTSSDYAHILQAPNSPAHDMWLSHIAAAVLTIALLAYGERAVIALGALVLRLTRRFGQNARNLGEFCTNRCADFTTAPSHARSFFWMNSITHRGPPRAVVTMFSLAA